MYTNRMQKKTKNHALLKVETIKEELENGKEGEGEETTWKQKVKARARLQLALSYQSLEAMYYIIVLHISFQLIYSYDNVMNIINACSLLYILVMMQFVYKVSKL